MKKIKNNNPLGSLMLDEKEKSLEEAFERGEYEESSGIEDTRKMLQEAASRYLELHNSKPVTLRINQLDLIKIKAKANMNNIPYQTLLGALLHDFAEGETKLSI